MIKPLNTPSLHKETKSFHSKPVETMLLVSLLINKKLPMSSKFFNYAILLNLPASKKLWRYNFWLRCHQLFFVFLRLKLVSLMSQAFGQSFAYAAYLHLCHKKYNNHYFENVWSEKKKHIYIFGGGGGEERGVVVGEAGLLYS